MNEETKLYGYTMQQIKEMMEWWHRNDFPEVDELLEENLKLRAKVSFYESRVKQMAEAMK